MTPTLEKPKVDQCIELAMIGARRIVSKYIDTFLRVDDPASFPNRAADCLSASRHTGAGVRFGSEVGLFCEPEIEHRQSGNRFKLLVQHAISRANRALEMRCVSRKCIAETS
jgi:hypothetical protein